MDWVASTIEYFEKVTPPYNPSESESLLKDIMYEVLAQKGADVVTTTENNLAFATCFFSLERHKCQIIIKIEKAHLRHNNKNNITRKIIKALGERSRNAYWESKPGYFCLWLDYFDIDV